MSVLEPSTGMNRHQKAPSSQRVSFNQPWVSLNLVSMYAGDEVKSLSRTPPVDTWNAVVPSPVPGVHVPSARTGQVRS